MTCKLLLFSSLCSCGPLGEEEEDSDLEGPDVQEVTQSQSIGVFHAFPDLSPAIDLHFHQSSQSTGSPSSNPFSHFEKYYQEHHRLLREEEHRQKQARKTSDCVEQVGRCLAGHGHSTSSTEHLNSRDNRNMSSGSISAPSLLGQVSLEAEELPPIWCLECQNALVLVGCGTGRVEVWDMYSCLLKCVYEERMWAGGVTSMRMSGNRVMVARLSGIVDMLLLEAATTVTPSSTTTIAPTASPLHQQHADGATAYPLHHNYQHPLRPGHSRGSSGSGWTFSYDETLMLVRYAGMRAHQQPITVMTCDHTRLITGAHDHTLKVFSMVDGSALFTLHGHCGPITSVFVDGGSLEALGSEGEVAVDLGVGAIIGSGSQDGMLCVWDVVTGACVYSVQAHHGAITTLTCTTSYILSLGEDDKLCVWERFQGHLLNTLQMTQMYCTSMVMLTNKLLITSRQGSLTVWDITSGTPVRVVRLGDRDESVFIRHLMPVADTIVCDYGNQLRVVRLPVAEKYD